MTARLATALLILTAAACRPYDTYGPLAKQGGLMPADAYAAYGPEQAQAVAIGRELARARASNATNPAAEQMGLAIMYAQRLPDVKQIKADTLGYTMTVTFTSGWRKGIIPIDDGKAGSETPGLPAGTGK